MKYYSTGGNITTARFFCDFRCRRRSPFLFLFAFIHLLFSSSGFCAATVVLTDGTRLVGQVVTRTNDQLVLKTTHLGELTLSAANIQSFDAGVASPHVVGTPPRADSVQPNVATQAASSGAVDAEQKKPKRWSSTATVGFSWTGSQANKDFVESPLNPGIPGDITGYTAKASISRQGEKWLITGKGEITYSKVEPLPRAQADNWSLGLEGSRVLNKDWTALWTGTYRQDDVSQDNQFHVLLGAGRSFIKTKKMDLYLVPGLAYVEYDYGEDNALAQALGLEGQKDFGVGLVNTFKYQFNPYMALEQTGTFIQSVEDFDVTYVIFNAKFVGMLTKRVGLQVSYDLNYNSVRPEPYLKTTQMLSTGLQFNY